MDRNSWIGLLLIVGTLFVWSYFTKPTEEEIAAQKIKQDSIAMVQKERAISAVMVKEQSKTNAKISDTESRTEDVIVKELNDAYGDFGKFATGKREFYTLENDLLKVQLTNLGARVYSVELKKYKTWDGKPLILFEGDSTEFALNFFSKNRSISTDKLFFSQLEGIESKKVSDKAESFTFKLAVEDSKYVEFIYTISPNSYVIDFDVNFVNVNNLIAANTGYITLNWNSYITGFEKGENWEEQNTSIFYKFNGAEVESLSLRSESANETLSTPLKWISYKQQFFNATLITKNTFSNALVKAEKEIINPKYLKHFTSEISVPYDGKATESIPMQFYFGPNHYRTLKNLDLDLEEVIPLGRSVFRWVNVGFVIPVFNWLGKYISNYGLIILILTILIKIIIFPFTYKSYMSTAKMKALKPEVDKIGEKFPKKEDAMKKQQATMALYKKVGVSPMGGCLPMLFQMPLLIAMFRFFPSSIELRQEGFLWATDLSTYDAVINLPFTVPFNFGSHISLFALLMTVVNIVYMKFNDQMSMGNQQMPGMKMMMYMMPFMMLFWFNSYASALSYYYFLSLLITIIQTWLIRRTVNDEEILAKLKAVQSNKKAPVKSKFQQRLENMAKQKGIQPPKR
ncbi:MAG: membrane protein insertase YidC [Salinivirgaceae bacterium]|nr:membrane protein insertase YidC [Salinivirgaceae bacterium]